MLKEIDVINDQYDVLSTAKGLHVRILGIRSAQNAITMFIKLFLGTITNKGIEQRHDLLVEKDHPSIREQFEKDM